MSRGPKLFSLPEQQLLASACSLDMPHLVSHPTPALDEIDWALFLHLANRHRVAQLVFRNLSHRPDRMLPAPVMEQLRLADQENAYRCLRLAHHLITLTNELSGKGVPVLPLKGIALAVEYYPGIGSRYAGDLDILVPREGLSLADKVLRDLGYVRIAENSTHEVQTKPIKGVEYFRKHFLYVAPDRVLVELHHSLHNNPNVLPVSFQEILRAGGNIQIGPQSINTLSSTMQFLFLSTHGARHEWERLQWVCDIARMVQGADETSVEKWLEAAAVYRLTNPSVQALVLTERLLGVAMPARVEREYSRSRAARFMVKWAEQAISARNTRVANYRPQVGKKFYRLFLMPTGGYLRHEFQRGLQVASRIAAGQIGHRIRRDEHEVPPPSN